MFVDKKRDDIRPHAHMLLSFCMHSTSTGALDASEHAQKHTHLPSIMEAEKTTCNTLVSPHTAHSFYLQRTQ